jgi:sugar fermentation stimulation protein A
MRKNMSSLENLPEKGTYLLIISVADKLKVKVRRLGVKTFLAGYYVYTGSAVGKGSTSLPNRLARHLRTVKRKHWHIDFLLAAKNVSIKAVVVIPSKQNLECEVNQHIKKQMKAKVLIRKFGASDCENRCESHLLFLPDVANCEVLARKLVKLFHSLYNECLVCVTC